MLAVQVELLTGRYVATRYNDRTKVEWPPHPARLFSAAVAAWADARDADGGDDDRDDDERAALLWWEALGAPDITCSWGADGAPGERAAVTHYVADNDPQAVRRDLSATYAQLRQAVEARDRADGVDPQAKAKAEKALAKAQEKARIASAGAGEGLATAVAAQVLPELRGRKARVYPSITPESDRVVYAWPDGDPDAPEAAVLDRVLARVARLGHSSSMVSVAVSTEPPPPPTLHPHELGDLPVRVPSAGQLDALERAFAAHGGSDPRILPAVVEPYRHISRTHQAEPPRPLLGDDWVLLGIEGRSFDVRDALALARTVRKALMHHSPVQPAPPVLSGHEASPTGASPPLQRPHLAVLALPFVGHERADGRVSAVALVLPRSASDDERVQVIGALNRWLDDGGALRMGTTGAATVTSLEAAGAPWSAGSRRWCAASTAWASVTPVALDRFPGRGASGDERAVEILAASCDHIGLPRPARVWLDHNPPVRGSRVARRFPPFATQDGRHPRLLTHVRLEFAEPVAGPVLLGAGRYSGYGLFAPIRGGGAS